MALTTAQILDGAARLVERGWCQDASARDLLGRSVLPTGRWARKFCAHGAMIRVVAFDRTAPGEGNLCEADRYLRGRTGNYVPVWNDAQGRTKAEVVTALRQAATDARYAANAARWEAEAGDGALGTRGGECAR